MLMEITPTFTDNLGHTKMKRGWSDGPVWNDFVFFARNNGHRSIGTDCLPPEHALRLPVWSTASLLGGVASNLEIRCVRTCFEIGETTNKKSEVFCECGVGVLKTVRCLSGVGSKDKWWQEEFPKRPRCTNMSQFEDEHQVRECMRATCTSGSSRGLFSTVSALFISSVFNARFRVMFPAGQMLEGPFWEAFWFQVCVPEILQILVVVQVMPTGTGRTVCCVSSF